MNPSNHPAQASCDNSQVPPDEKQAINHLFDRPFLDSLFEGIVVYKKSGELMLVNKAAEDIFKIPTDYIKDHTVMDSRWDTIREDGKPFPVEEHPSMQALKTGLPHRNVIMGVRNPTGKIHWIRLSAQPGYHTGSTTPDFVTCSFIDITEQRQAEQSRVNERYEYARKATSDAIWDWEIENDIVYHGASSNKLFEFDNLSTSMEKHTAHIHPEDRDHYNTSIREALASTNDYWEAEYRLQDIKKRYHIILDRAYILRDENKKAIRMIGAMQDISERRKLEEKLLQETVIRKREIVKAIISAQEKERKEISYELHDNLTQLLATCRLYVDVASKKVKNEPLLKECNELLLKAIEEVRNLSHNLTPAAFEEKGLFQAVIEMVEKLNSLGKVPIMLIVPDSEELEKRLLPDMKTAIFRIIQEQLNNTLKHAQASQIHIKIEQMDALFHLEIRDNGIGFEAAKIKKGLGINNIQSRVSLYGGQMNLQSTPGKGCVLKVVLPLGTAERAMVK
jgi:two-component system sensor histidine kinase UhpB